METSKKTLEFKFDRTIPALQDEVFDGWLNPKIPGNPWNMAEKLLLNPKVDGFFLLAHKGEFPLRAIYGNGATKPNSAYMDVTKHLG
jgi:hypothetical protein